MWMDDAGDTLAPVENWYDQTGTTANNGPQVQANDVFTQSTVTEGQDRWGWLTSLVDKGVSYAIARDAAKSGLTRGVTPNGQPVYQQVGTASPTPGAMSQGAVLMIGGAIVVGLLLVAVAGKKG